MATIKGVMELLLKSVANNPFSRRSSRIFFHRAPAVNMQMISVQSQIRHSSTGNDQAEKDQPIAYSKSPAQQHTVNDTLHYDSNRINSYRTFIVCFGVFSFVMYYGFIREETESEKKLFEVNEMQENSLESKAEQVSV